MNGAPLLSELARQGSMQCIPKRGRGRGMPRGGTGGLRVDRRCGSG